MILEAMYNGEFYPCETVVPTSPEYRKAVIAPVSYTHLFSIQPGDRLIVLGDEAQGLALLSEKRCV